MIPGPSDIYVKQGSEVVLTCIVSQGPHELGQIFWLRGKYYPFAYIHSHSHSLSHKYLNCNQNRISQRDFITLRLIRVKSYQVPNTISRLSFLNTQPSAKYLMKWICLHVLFNSILGKSMIDPKTSYHLNDIFEYPDRITISTESNDVLQSR